MAELELMKPPRRLSARQETIVSFVRHFMSEHEYAPSIREIQEGTGISSTSVVDYNLSAIRRAGLLRKESNVARSIRLIGAALRTGLHCPTCMCVEGFC